MKGTLCIEHWHGDKLIENNCIDIDIVDNGMPAILKVNFGQEEITSKFYWPPIDPLLIPES